MINPRDELSRQLNALLGVSRNGSVDAQSVYKSMRVCKNFLATGFCVKEELLHTREQVGMCHLEHDEAARKAYLASSDRFKLGYERNAYEDLKDFSMGMRKAIRENMRKHKGAVNYGGETDELRMSSADSRMELERVERDIEIQMAQASAYAEQGNLMGVDAAFDVAEKLKAKLANLHTIAAASRRLRDAASMWSICEVCNLRLDPQRPNDAEHESSRVHKAMILVKDTLEELFGELDRADPEWGKRELRKKALKETDFVTQQDEIDKEFEKRADGQYRLGSEWLKTCDGMAYRAEKGMLTKEEKDTMPRSKKEEKPDLNREANREKRDMDRNRDRDRDRNRVRDRDRRRRSRSRSRRRSPRRQRSRSPVRNRDSRRSRSPRRRSRSRDRTSSTRDRRRSPSIDIRSIDKSISRPAGYDYGYGVPPTGMYGCAFTTSTNEPLSGYGSSSMPGYGTGSSSTTMPSYGGSMADYGISLLDDPSRGDYGNAGSSIGEPSTSSRNLAEYAAELESAAQASREYWKMYGSR